MSEIRTGCNDSCPYYENNIGCFKPEGLFCPPMSTTITDEDDPYKKQCAAIVDAIDKSIGENTSIKYEVNTRVGRKCIICGKTITNTEEMVCEECKDAIAWVKRHISFQDFNGYLGSKGE